MQGLLESLFPGLDEAGGTELDRVFLFPGGVRERNYLLTSQSFCELDGEVAVRAFRF